MPKRSLTRRIQGDDAGVVIVIFSLILIGLMVVTAIVVDLGDSQQQKRQARSAADAGALAGAQALSLADGATPTPAGCQLDTVGKTARCVAAYDAYQSVNISVNAATLAAVNSGACGQGCTRYLVSGTTIEVTSPYAFGGHSANQVHVNVCWDDQTQFAKVGGVSSVHVCGAATARNTGVKVDGSDPPTSTSDCIDEDLFADQADNPRIYVFKGAGDFNSFIGHAWNPTAKAFTPTAANPIKHDYVMAVEYESFDGGYTSPALTTVTGPTLTSGPNGLVATIPPSINIGTSGKIDSNKAKGFAYMMYGINGGGNVGAFNTSNPQSHGLIVYMLPDDKHLKDKDAEGNYIAYELKIHANDVDNTANPATRCGNAGITFAGTGDGKGLTTGLCGEDSFLANGVFPKNGLASPGDPVGAYYSDESPIQKKDYNNPFWATQAGYPETDFGIILEISGGSFTDPTTGAPTHINQSASPGNVASTDGYTLTPAPTDQPQTIVGLAHPDKYNTKINFFLPGPTDPRWVNGVEYTVHLKAYDTDNNKPGNDCGQGTWKFVIHGAQNGNVILME